MIKSGYNHETVLSNNIHSNNYYHEEKSDKRKYFKNCSILNCDCKMYKENKCFKHWYLNKENINE